MENNFRTYGEEAALAYLPITLAEAVRKTSALYNGFISEIRLRVGVPVYITVRDKNISCGTLCTYDMVAQTVRALCGNSLYCHSETIREGYICTAGGIRAGVCGRAVTENGKIISVCDITSVAIRIPHRIPGAGDEVSRLIVEENAKGVLIYSPPGVGKTTVLRELAARLAVKPFCLRVAVVDTRYEICGALGSDMTVDALSGYPRGKGIETAVRTLSPQLIICDEIGSEEDAAALTGCAGAGIPVAASVHAGSFEEVMKKKYVRSLIEEGIFDWAVGLERTENKLRCHAKRISSVVSVLC